MQGPLEIRLLGGLSVATDRPIQFPTRKTGLLFAYLAMHPGEDVARDRLKTLLWSDRSEQQASGSLRRALADVRKSLDAAAGPDLLATTSSTVAMPADAVDVDARRFQALANDGAAEAAIAAAALYRGDLLGEEAAPDPAFEDWLRIERARLRSLAEVLAERVADLAQGEAALAAASALASRLLRSDPACEEAHRALILCYRKAGRQNAAVKQYAACVEALRTTLGVEPEDRTRALLQDAGVSVATGAGAAGGSGGDHPVLAGTDALERPSIAVLPFEDHGIDPDQRYIAEGMAADILTELSRIRDFLVVSGQSSFTMRDASPAEIHRQLGARYIISGAVRVAAGTIRVNAQLVDATSGVQLWAHRYDQRIVDTFAVQDQITDEIVRAIDPELRISEQGRAARMQPEDLTAWERFHRGMWHVFRMGERELERANALFTEARRCCRNDYAAPLAGLACASLMRITTGVADDPGAALREALALGEEALAIDPSDGFCLTIHATALSLRGHYSDAMAHVDQAIAQNPNFVMAHYCRAQLLLRTGRYEESLASIADALLRSPRDPQLSSFLAVRASCYYGLDAFAEMRETARAAVRLHAPEYWSRLLLAVAALNLAAADEAARAIAAVRRDFPTFSKASVRLLTDHTTAEFGQRFAADLDRLGVE